MKKTLGWPDTLYSSEHLSWDSSTSTVTGLAIEAVGDFTFSISLDLVIDKATFTATSSFNNPVYTLSSEVLETRTYNINVSVTSDCEENLLYGSTEMQDIEVIDVSIFMSSRLGVFTPLTFEIPTITSCPRMTLDSDDVEPTPWVTEYHDTYDWESSTTMVISGEKWTEVAGYDLLDEGDVD